MKFLKYIAAAVAILVAAPVAGQTARPPNTVLFDTNSTKPVLPNATYCLNTSNAWVPCAAEGGSSAPVTGTYNSTAPTLTNGQTAPLQQDSRANLEVSIFGANTAAAITNTAPILGARAVSGINALDINAFMRVHSGTTSYGWSGTTAGYGYIVSVADSSNISGVAPVSSTVAEGGRIIKAGAGNLYGLNVASGATAGVVQVLNSATIPADGAVTPIKCYYLAANSSLDLNLRAAPVYASTGVVVVFSSGTSCFTKAASATAFISGDAK